MSRTEGYPEFVRSTTPHLHVEPLRPVLLLGIRRWLVRSISSPHFRPVVVWGDETRARNRAQRLHRAHAQAREAIRLGYDLAGDALAEREFALLHRDDPDLRVPDPADADPNGPRGSHDET